MAEQCCRTVWIWFRWVQMDQAIMKNSSSCLSCLKIHATKSLQFWNASVSRKSQHAVSSQTQSIAGQLHSAWITLSEVPIIYSRCDPESFCGELDYSWRGANFCKVSKGVVSLCLGSPRTIFFFQRPSSLTDGSSRSGSASSSFTVFC